jgi:hypothetical protein
VPGLGPSNIIACSPQLPEYFEERKGRGGGGQSGVVGCSIFDFLGGCRKKNKRTFWAVFGKLEIPSLTLKLF